MSKHTIYSKYNVLQTSYVQVRNGNWVGATAQDCDGLKWARSIAMLGMGNVVTFIRMHVHLLAGRSLRKLHFRKGVSKYVEARPLNQLRLERIYLEGGIQHTT